MKISFPLFLLTLVLTLPALADPALPADQQTCRRDSDCTLVSLTCGNACASIPISADAKNALAPDLRQKCGGALPEESGAVCKMNPPLKPACINQRCTVGYAFEKHAGLADYQTSAAPPSARANP